VKRDEWLLRFTLFSIMNEKRHTLLTDNLLTWYGRVRRDLPWRRTRDPYHIWVAEVMLQQTQVVTVMPYYERFLARFPTVEALAAASLDGVLKLWEGLGYYARARHLHAAARKVVAEFDGRVPDAMDDLLSLPGVGRYTAGAILSMAYGQDVPALDGNVRRVLSRLFAVEEDVTRGAGQRRLWALAEGLLLPGQAGDLNQALMDLGATVCTPQSPMCDSCPLAEDCQAHELGREEQFPIRRQRRSLPHYEVAAGVVWNGEGCFLIAQRPLDGMLGGLWEFPGGTREEGESLQDCLRRELVEELDIEVTVGDLLTVVQHAYTHFRITMHAFHCQLLNGQPRALGCIDWRWISLDDVARFAFSAADHQIIAALRDPSEPPG
jgi:A/G-specific adenine glycosylase